MELHLIGIFISLLLAIFFSGIEVAFLSSNKLQIEVEGRQGDISGRIMMFFLERPTWFIGTTLIGNIGSLLSFSAAVTLLVVPWVLSMAPVLSSVHLLIILLTFLLTLIVIYSAEFLSKSLFVINANKMLSWMAVPFVFISMALFPLVYLIISLSKLLIVSVFRLEYSQEKPLFGLTDVNQYLKIIHRIKPSGEDIELDKKILNNALDFRTVRVRDCMIPRTEIVAVNIETSIEKLQEAFVESGHSKILIYKDNIDDVIGYCHSSALFKKPHKIEEILTPIITVPESTLANELMITLINERKSLAVAVDEFGGTSGLVSMEDIIEEIFGEIEDEHDEDHLIEQQISDSTYLFSARLEIDYLNETYKLQLPVGDYETLGGLILQYVRDIPKAGETVSIPPYTFIVQQTEETRILTIRLEVAEVK